MSLRPPVVAVVDIGSNSIKLLVATAGADGRLHPLAQRTEETRIGTGITGNPPRLHEDAMDRAVEAVRTLLCTAAPFEPATIRLVATSAVRDAVNRADFAARLFDATTHELAILDGREEARLIGRGIACDPALEGAPAFHLFDLGGGSLELLTFRAGRVVGLASLPLGCVRLTERWIPDPAAPIPPEAVAALRAHVREVVRASGFRFDLPDPVAAVATGGTATTFRAILAEAAGVALAVSEAVLPLEAMAELARRLCAETVAQRRARPGVPAARADVLPAALVTLGEVAALARAPALRHSLFNLRFGLAAELLEGDRR